MEPKLILYNSADGKSRVSLLERDGSVWLNQSQLAELFATSAANISLHVKNILKDKELDVNSVVKYYLTTAPDSKSYPVRNLLKSLRFFNVFLMSAAYCSTFFAEYSEKCIIFAV